MQEYLYDSLYFQVSRVNRNISRIADDEFRKIGLPPSYGLLLLLLDEWKELTPTEISKYLDVMPSTTTRFLNKLHYRKLIKKRIEGKFSYISLSNDGAGKIHEIRGAFETLEIKLNKMVTSKISSKHKQSLMDMSDRIRDKVEMKLHK